MAGICSCGALTPCGSNGADVPLYPGLTIPVMTHMLFQGMFFIITPALICGAFAERMKFSAMMALTALWGLLVYCPLAHWIWGGGILAYGSPHAAGFAGGRRPGLRRRNGGPYQFRRVGLGLCAVVGQAIGPRERADAAAQYDLHRPGGRHALGRLVRFQRRQRLVGQSLATCAFAATHFAAAAGGLTWAALEWKFRGKPSVLGACSGLVAGLATITQAAGYVTLMPALLIGAIGATVCYLACTPEDVFRLRRFARRVRRARRGRHLGALLTGIFATRATGACGDAKLLGLLEGGPLLKAQCMPRSSRPGDWPSSAPSSFSRWSMWPSVCGYPAKPKSKVST